MLVLSCLPVHALLYVSCFNFQCCDIVSPLHLPPPFLSVRQKAKEIIVFLQDEERLRDARKQAKQTRDKYVGYSSDEQQQKYSESQ